MNNIKNSLDSFNEDKTKCEKCKEYFDTWFDKFPWTGSITPDGKSKLCVKCDEIYNKFWNNHRIVEKPLNMDLIYKEFINDKQTRQF